MCMYQLIVGFPRRKKDEKKIIDIVVRSEHGVIHHTDKGLMIDDCSWDVVRTMKKRINEIETGLADYQEQVN